MEPFSGHSVPWFIMNSPHWKRLYQGWEREGRGGERLWSTDCEDQSSVCQNAGIIPSRFDSLPVLTVDGKNLIPERASWLQGLLAIWVSSGFGWENLLLSNLDEWLARFRHDLLICTSHIRTEEEKNYQEEFCYQVEHGGKVTVVYKAWVAFIVFLT